MFPRPPRSTTLRRKSFSSGGRTLSEELKAKDELIRSMESALQHKEKENSSVPPKMVFQPPKFHVVKEYDTSAIAVAKKLEADVGDLKGALEKRSLSLNESRSTVATLTKSLIERNARLAEIEAELGVLKEAHQTLLLKTAHAPLAPACTHCKTYQTSISSLRKDLIAKDGSIDKLKDQHSATKAALCSSQQGARSLELSLQDCKDQLLVLDNNCGSLEEQLGEASAYVLRLTGELDGWRAVCKSPKEISELKVLIKLLNQRVLEKEEECASRLKTSQKAAATIRELRSDLEKLKKLSKSGDVSKSKILELEKQLKAQTAAVASLRALNADLERKLSVSAANFEKESRLLRDKHQSVCTERDRALQGQADALKLLREREAECKALKARISAEENRRQNELNNSSEQARAKEAVIVSLRGELAEVKGKLSSSTVGLSLEMETLRRINRELEEKLSDAQRLLTAVEKQKASESAALRREIEEASKHADVAKELQQTLRQKEKGRKELQLQLDRLGRQLENSTQKVAELRAAVKLLESQLEKALAGDTAKGKEIDVLQSMLKRLKDELGLAQRQQGGLVLALREEVGNLKIQLKEAQQGSFTTIEALQDELRTAKAQVVAVGGKNDSLSTTIEALRKELDRLALSEKRLCRDALHSRGDADSASSELEALKEQLKAVQAKHKEDVSRQTLAGKAELRKLKQQLDSKSQQLSGLLKVQDEHARDLGRAQGSLEKLNSDWTAKLRSITAERNSAQRAASELKKLLTEAQQELSKRPASPSPTDVKAVVDAVTKCVSRELKIKSAIMNLEGLVKAAETTNARKDLQLVEKELELGKQHQSVLLYNISACEKNVRLLSAGPSHPFQLAKFDKKAAAKQARARESRMRKLDDALSKDREEIRSFKSTSVGNLEMLGQMLREKKEELTAAGKLREGALKRLVALAK